MGSIVVGIDASEESREALEWARTQAGPDDRIIAVHAWDIPLVAGYEMAVAIDPNEIREGALGFLQRVADEIGDPRVVARLAQGHPGRSIVEIASGTLDDDDEPADMVVIGHRGTGRASMILGSTANYVTHHLERPVVVIRGEYSGAPVNVAVGVDDHGIDDDDGDGDGDGENASVRALRFAYGLRGVEHIAVVHSWFAPAVAAGLYAGAGADIEQMDAEAVAVAEHVMACAGDAPEGVVVRAVPERGTAGFALVEASNDADLVVVGSRGRGGFLEVLLGSTTLEVASHSHAPVAIIR